MTVHISHKHKVVGVPFAEEVQNLFPNAKALDIGGKPHLALPHELTETFLLRKLGFDVPSPILTHYDWAGGTPFEVQKQTCALETMNQRCYVLNDMGTGKTKTPLWSWDYLRSNKACGKMLVIAPLSTLNFVWAREVFNTLPHRKCAILHGTKKRRLQRLSDPDTEIFIINPDGMNLIYEELAKRTDIDVLCVDELAAYRNGSPERTKKLIKFAATMKWVWGMTGSPIPHSPTDAWAQARIVTPTTVPKHFGHFRDALMTKVADFRYLPKPDAVDRAYAALQPAVRFTLEDVVELPECVERFVDIEQGTKQATVYKALAGAAFAAVQSQEITAANAGAVLNKLLQVSLGWVYDSKKNVVPLDNEKRIEALVDAVNAGTRKVLVFVPYKHALAGISAALDAEGIDHVTMSGDTPPNKRPEIFNLFQNTDRYKVFLAHPTCVAHGVTLTAADTVIWFAPVLDYDTYSQACKRIRRYGQKFKQLILHFQGTPVERKAYAALRSKHNMQESLLDLFEAESENNPQK